MKENESKLHYSVLPRNLRQPMLCPPPPFHTYINPERQIRHGKRVVHQKIFMIEKMRPGLLSESEISLYHLVYFYLSAAAPVVASAV